MCAVGRGLARAATSLITNIPLPPLINNIPTRCARLGADWREQDVAALRCLQVTHLPHLTNITLSHLTNVLLPNITHIYLPISLTPTYPISLISPYPISLISPYPISLLPATGGLGVRQTQSESAVAAGATADPGRTISSSLSSSSSSSLSLLFQWPSPLLSDHQNNRMVEAVTTLGEMQSLSPAWYRWMLSQVNTHNLT